MSIYFRDTCTCSGPVPGWNQHEAWCGTREDRGSPYNRWSHPDANLPTETPKAQHEYLHIMPSRESPAR